MVFSERLRELRLEKGLTQDALAIATGLSHGCIAMLETNKRMPTGSTIISLAEFFEVSSDYLLGLENEFGTKQYAPPIKNVELTPDVKELVDLYHLLSSANRLQVLEYARFMAEREHVIKKRNF